MWVWDELIRNVDRNQGNIIFDPDGYLWWIDHTRSLSQNDELFKPERVLRCSKRLYEGMRKLDEESALEALGELLNRQEIKALIKRRDRVLTILDERIGRLGEPAVLFRLHERPTASQ